MRRQVAVLRIRTMPLEPVRANRLLLRQMIDEGVHFLFGQQIGDNEVALGVEAVDLLSLRICGMVITVVSSATSGLSCHLRCPYIKSLALAEQKPQQSALF